MKRLSLFVILLCVLFSPSCIKTNNTQPGGKVYNSVNDINVPSGFNWESSRNIPFIVSITDDRFAAAYHTISVYDGNPFAGGNLLAKGSANTAHAYAATLYIARAITEVYVVKTSPDKSMIVQKVALGTAVSLSIGATDPNAAGKPAHREGAQVLDDCNSGCTNTITTSTSGIDVHAGDVICITGSNITVGFNNVNDGTIRVCGTNVTLQNLNLNAHATLLITSGASVTLSGFNYNAASASVINYGTLNGSFADGGYFTNYGLVNMGSDFNLNGSSQTFINDGTIMVPGNFNYSSNFVATNNGTINVAGNFQVNGGSACFTNYCSLIVSGNYNQSALVKNYAFIKVSGTSTINNGSELILSNGAMFKTNNFILDGSRVTAYGSTSLVKITGTTNIMNSGASFTGLVQICAPTAIPAANLFMGAANGCSLYIPTTGCNTDGNGSAATADGDGDGIPDVLDDYPTDATRAYNNYYPASAGGGTVAFEDQWPSKGDFDMNDVVVGYRYQVVTNAANNVVKVIANYTLLATGGSLGNGFGVEFPISSGNVSNITGGTLEAGQSKAVVIVFSNMRNEMAHWNTVPGETVSPVNNYTVSFDVTNGPNISTFGLSSYNPFIWNFGLGNNRGREIHLAGHTPTDLGYTSYFGTADDSSVAASGRYYVTKTGLPYAIDVPLTPFNYPIEQADITKAFLHFGAWGESGGTSFPDWYSNTASDYRNGSYIFLH